MSGVSCVRSAVHLSNFLVLSWSTVRGRANSQRLVTVGQETALCAFLFTFSFEAQSCVGGRQPQSGRQCLDIWCLFFSLVGLHTRVRRRAFRVLDSTCQPT